MKERCIVDLFALLGILAGKLGDLFRVLGNSGGVTLCILVLGIDRACESLSCLCEQSLGSLSLIFQIIDLDLPRTLDSLIHVMQREQIQKGRQKSGRDVDQRQSV